MPVPKRKTSRSRRDKRSSHSAFKPKTFTSCLTCKSLLLPHQVCRECGYYKGVKVLRTKTDRMNDRGRALQDKRARIEHGKTKVVSEKKSESGK